MMVNRIHMPARFGRSVKGRNYAARQAIERKANALRASVCDMEDINEQKLFTQIK